MPGSHGIHMPGSLVFTSTALIFVTAMLWIPFDQLDLVASRTYVPGSHKTVRNGGSVLNWHHPHGIARGHSLRKAGLGIGF